MNTQPPKKRNQPTHKSCRWVAAMLRTNQPVPENILKAHVPGLVSRTGDLIYRRIPVTPESCQRVSDAIRFKKEFVPRDIYLAHVPDYVTPDGGILQTEENNYTIDLDNGMWIGIVGNRIHFGHTKREQPVADFVSHATENLPTEDELGALGDLLVGGISYQTANNILFGLAAKKTNRIFKETHRQPDLKLAWDYSRPDAPKENQPA